jgi:hypothetical protein
MIAASELGTTEHFTVANDAGVIASEIPCQFSVCIEERGLPMHRQEVLWLDNS